jgi:uncharacterized Zn finger protein (UPF0148 family)
MNASTAESARGLTTAEVSCKQCGGPIRTAVRGNTVRCPSCRTPNYVPKRTRPESTVTASTGTAPAALPATASTAGPVAWCPGPLPDVEAEESGQDCPECGDALVWETAGTLLYCRTCEQPVFPPSLLPAAPVEGDPRRVATQAERDDAALELAERRAVVLEALGRVLAHDDLRADTRGRLGWYVEEIRAATTMSRLESLVERLAAERIRRTRWYSRNATNPAAIVAEVIQDDPDSDDQDDDYAEDIEDSDQDPDEYPYVPPGTLVPALPAPRLDHRAVIESNGFYQPYPNAPAGACQILHRRSGMNGQILDSPRPCGGGGSRQFGPYRLCPGHAQQFTGLSNER